MRLNKRLMIVGLAFSAIFSGFLIYNATAQTAPLTDQQIELIRTNCVTTKVTLAQLHSSDALLRVNVGQLYESMSAKLMEKFNVRATAGGLNSAGLITATTNYGQLLDTFRADYILYEKQLSAAININCSAYPAAFYDAAMLAKAKREQIHADVVNLNQSLDQYQAAIIQFETDNQIKIGGLK